MSPDPVMFTLAVPASLLNPTETSAGMRPRQSKVIVFSSVMKVTLVSSGKSCVVTGPPELKSIDTRYDDVVSICTDVCP